MFVERRENGEIQRDVYCLSTDRSFVNLEASVTGFINDICTWERYGSLRVWYCRHHSEECRRNGVCVVPVVPRFDRPIDGEDPHCWREFRTAIFLPDLLQKNSNLTELTLLLLETSDYLPHYCMVTNVSNFQLHTVGIVDFIRQHAVETAEELDLMAAEFEIWFERTDPESSSWLFGVELTKISGLLTHTLVSVDSIYERLEWLRKGHPVEAKMIAGELLLHYDRLMRVFRLAVSDLTEASEIKAHLAKFSILLTQFADHYALGRLISDKLMRSKPDRMSVTYDFE
jgi:hypothetical protein